MFRLSKTFFTVFVATAALSASPALGHKREEDDRVQRPTGGLRGRSNAANTRDSPRRLDGNVDDPEDVPDEAVIDDDIVRVIVECPSGVSHQQCLEDIQKLAKSAGIGAHGDISIVHDLDTIDAVAISLDLADLPLLAGYDYFEDMAREPLYIHDSVVVEEADQNDRKLQGNTETTPYGIDMVNAPQVWESFGTKGAGATVCVLDTGILSDHEDFDISRLDGYNGGEAVTPWDADGNGHGTHVSGTIGASDNNVGVIGVAPEAKIFTVRVFNDQGIFSSDLMKAAAQCVDGGADIISMSLGGGGSSSRERAFFEQLYSQGILSVAASGNSGGTTNAVNYPAAYDIVVSVAAVDSSKNLASFSTRNNRVDLAAPGVDVRSTWNNGRYATISGTSMACPHVSGVAALLRSYDKNLTTAELFTALTSTAEDRGPSGKDSSFGHGIVDALAAIESLGDSSGGDNSDENDGGDDGGNDGADDLPCLEIRVDIRLDLFPGDISHSLRNLATGEEVWKEDSYRPFERDTQTVCVDRLSCWRYEIVDSYGDGLLGYGGIALSEDGEVLYRGGNFGTGGYRDFGLGCE